MTVVHTSIISSSHSFRLFIACFGCCGFLYKILSAFLRWRACARFWHDINCLGRITTQCCAQNIKIVRFEWPTRCAQHVAPTYMPNPKLRRVLLYLLFLFLFASWVVRQAQAFIIIIIIGMHYCCCCCAGTSSFRLFFRSSILFSPSLAFEQYCTDGEVRARTDIIPVRYYLEYKFL